MFKLSKLVALSALFIMPFMGYAHDNIAKLKDFAGSYATHGFSAGGVAGPDTNTGLSQVNVAQISIDKKGNGLVNFISYSVYSGPIGSYAAVISSFSGAPPFTFTLELVDPAHITGTVAIHDFPVPGDTLSFQSVGRKDDGKIKEFWLNQVGGGPSQLAAPASANIIFAKRQ